MHSIIHASRRGLTFPNWLRIKNVLKISSRYYRNFSTETVQQQAVHPTVHTTFNDVDDKIEEESPEYIGAVSSFDDDIRTREGEVKDSELVFEIAWNNLADKYGDDMMIFPKDIMWLAGAPGSGKGLMTPFIMKTRGITASPIETSDLLRSPEAEAIKARGELVADRHVVQLVLQKLLDSVYASGVIVDGFPRTRVQGECIKHLYDKMRSYRRKYDRPPYEGRFRRPTFHITVLFIEEDQSVERQLNRGKIVMAHNKRVTETGVGHLKVLRLTDTTEELARGRYKQFKEFVFDSLVAVKDHFAFHFISADANPEYVKKRIQEELEYQSSLELHEITFEKVRRLPLASEVTENARYQLVKRLDTYSRDFSEMFDKVINILLNEFFGFIKLQALSGQVIIRSENPIFHTDPAIGMALDLLTERGFTAVIDFHRERYPQRTESNGLIILRERMVYEFRIGYPRPTIRHTHRFLSQ